MIFNHLGRLSAYLDLHSTKYEQACCDNSGFILSNKPRSFPSTCVIERRLSELHLMTLTVMKKSFRKFLPQLMILSQLIIVIGPTNISQMKSLGCAY